MDTAGPVRGSAMIGCRSMPRTRRSLLRVKGALAVVAFALSACSQPVTEANEDANDTVAVPVNNHVGGSVARTELVALTAKDIAGAELPGELSCGFADRGGNTLLYASGNVQSSENAVGLVKIAKETQRLTVPGGFNALVRGPTLAGSGLTVTVRHLDSRAPTGEESPPRPASITWGREGKASSSINGTWTCGP